MAEDDFVEGGASNASVMMTSVLSPLTLLLPKVNVTTMPATALAPSFYIRIRTSSLFLSNPSRNANAVPSILSSSTTKPTLPKPFTKTVVHLAPQEQERTKHKFRDAFAGTWGRKAGCNAVSGGCCAGRPVASPKGPIVTRNARFTCQEPTGRIVS